MEIIKALVNDMDSPRGVGVQEIQIIINLALQTEDVLEIYVHFKLTLFQSCKQTLLWEIEWKD